MTDSEILARDGWKEDAKGWTLGPFRLECLLSVHIIPSQFHRHEYLLLGSGWRLTGPGAANGTFSTLSRPLALAYLLEAEDLDF